MIEVVKKKSRSATNAEKQGWENFDGQETVILGDPGSLADGQAVQVAADGG